MKFRRFLEIDLSTASAVIHPLPPALQEGKYAGRILAVKLLAAAPAGDPLIIAPGALCGSGAPGANRCAIAFTSPLNSAIFSASEGGALPLSLQSTDFAAVVIRGQSDKPVLLRIDSKGGELLNGLPWWGEGAELCAAALGSAEAGVLTIGPAGEKGVVYASLHANDGNIFGRGGPGAVLGKKRVKAIVVVREVTATPQHAPPPAFTKACADLQRLLRASPLLSGPVGFAHFGEAALVDLAARRGLLPRNNFSATFPADASVFNGAAMRDSGTSQAFGCGDCPIACKRRDAAGHPLPGFFTLAAGGALLGLPDLPAIHRYNWLCNHFGLDPLSLAGALATRSEIEKLPLTIAGIEALVPLIANRRGEGALLADGAERYATQMGAPEVAITVRHLEIPPIDPRGLYGLALAHAVDPSGQGERALPFTAELLRKPVPVERLSWGGKARLILSNQRAAAAFDSLGLCHHLLYAAGLEEAAALFSAITGHPCNAAALADLGEEALTVEYALSRHATAPPGISSLPLRLFMHGGGDPLSSLPPLQSVAGEAEVQRYQRLFRPKETIPLPCPNKESDLLPLLRHFLAKLVSEGIAGEGRAALLAQDEPILALGPPDLVAQGRAILAQNDAAALCLLAAPWPFAEFLQRRSPQATVIVPRDSETRTFFHEIPVLHGDFDAQKISAALGCRKGVLLEGGIICASGSLTIEQAYVNASSLWHALSIKYLLDILNDGFLLEGEAAVFAAFRSSILGEPHSDGLIFRPPPLESAAEIEAEMIRVGRYTVERHLVDSFFGNISCRHKDEVFISATASSLDDLNGCIDPVPFDNRTTLGLVASSELAAHQGIYAATDAATILHGHPRFSVALSMLCSEEKSCQIGDCWRDCPRVRYLNNVPIISGEIGAGGLAKRVPPVIGASGSAIVYGHGVFCIGRKDFAEPFHALVAIERWCRQEYFRRLDSGTIFG